MVAVATGAWTGAPARGSTLAKRRRDALSGEFSSRTVDIVVKRLAKAGIGVYELGSDAPIVEPMAPVSPLRLSESQARNAALGAWARSGLTGAQLDELAPIPEDQRTLVPPVSALVAAYVDVGKTPGAKFARAVMGTQSWDDVHAVVFPAVILDLFVSDILTKAGGGTASGASAPKSVRLTAFDAPTATPGQAPSDVCTTAQTFVNKVVEGIFSVIPKVSPPDPSGITSILGTFLGSMINKGLEIGAKVVNGLVQGAQYAVTAAGKTLIQPVLNVVATIAGVVAVVAEVVTKLQPWALSVRADPSNTRKAVGKEKGLPGAFHLDVQTALLNGDWPADLVGCARVAGVTLPPLKPQDAPVRWTLSGRTDLIQPTSPTDTTLSKDSTADLEYETTNEPERNAKRGELQQGGVLATAHVTRNDLDQVQMSLVNLLYSQIPAAIAPIVTPALRSLLQPAISNALAGLTRLRDPAPSFATLIVAYHDPPKSKGGACGASAGPVSSGDWTIRPIVTCDRIGLKIEKVGGFKLNATFALLVDHPHLQLTTSNKKGKASVTGAELVGIKGVLIDFGAGAANPTADNVPFNYDVPLKVEIPVTGGSDDDPESVTVTWHVNVKPALTGQNATLLANGQYALNGSVGATKTPALSVVKSLTNSISGISLGPSGIVIAVKTQFTAGAETPAPAKGAFVSLTASFGVTNGSSLGASLGRCHGVTLDLSLGEHHGRARVTKTFFHRSETVPNVPLCTG